MPIITSFVQKYKNITDENTQIKLISTTLIIISEQTLNL
jgi:hypothetical protein